MKGQKNRIRFFERAVPAIMLAAALLFAAACEQLERPDTKAFYSETDPPRAQEFRWSNGKMPQSFDPARASAPPETDIVRAIYEGLTEIDPKSLEAVPGVAVRWESSDEGKVWTFDLRRDAKWTNGEPVTASDFVRSWKRLSQLEEPPAHFSLVSNIVGMDSHHPARDHGEDGQVPVPAAETEKLANHEATRSRYANAAAKANDKEKAEKPSAQPEFGAEAVEDFKLKVTLIEADTQFPRLAAQPILRPVYGDGENYKEKELSADIVTNGAFRVESINKNGVVLERSDNFFDRSSIALRKVHLIAAENADAALADYKSGKVDAVTNTEFEPLALKLLTPYVDFRRKTHSALNFYEFNRAKAPFNDRRVREALAIAIDRKRISEDLLEGATEPAYGFLPFGQGGTRAAFKEDVARARELMQKAGFQNGRDFPVIRLVINRNDQQRQIAEAVAGMWKENLGVETEIEMRDYDEMESVRESGDYDLIRRGAVLPTSDETANMLAIFHPAKEKAAGQPAAEAEKQTGPQAAKKAEQSKSKIKIPVMPPPITEATPIPVPEFDGLPPGIRDELTVEIGGEDRLILTEEEAVLEVPAIPLYFPTSYSLVKPYVDGFEINALDAPLLKIVRIDSKWRPDPSGNS